MAGWTPLLRVETAFVRITLSAPAALKQPTVPAGQIRAACTSASVDVWTSSRGGLDFGLWEQTPYELVVEPLDGLPVRVTSRSPSVVNDLSQMGSSGVVAGTLNLGSSIGMLTLYFLAGTEKVTISFEVFPSKLDYASDYRDILTDIDRHARELLLRYLGETERPTATTDNGFNTEAEWATILRNELATITQGIRLAEQRPLVNIVGQLEHVPIHKVKRSSTTTISSLLRQRGRGAWVEVANLPARERLPVDARVPSLDTPEHRWLQGQLHLVEIELTRINSTLRLHRNVPSGPGASVNTAALSAILSEFDDMSSLVRELRKSRLLRESSASAAMTRPTTALMTRLGYAEVYRSLRLLRHSLALFGDQLNVSVSQLSTLYEQWCFLEVVAEVSKLLGDRYEGPDYFATTQVLLSTSIDTWTPVVFRSGDARVLIDYNRTVSTETGKQRPDIVITVSTDADYQKYILDAKYRLTPPPNSEGFATPGASAIDAMHRYRDSITELRGSSHVRSVTQAIALFPASTDGGTKYSNAPLFQSILSVGVGALPFLPSNRAYFNAWLEGVLVSAGLVSK